MPRGKAPGVDGFPIEFFIRNWDLVKDDVLAAVEHFFQTGKLWPTINVTAITLIPKILYPTKVKDYMLIAY